MGSVRTIGSQQDIPVLFIEKMVVDDISCKYLYLYFAPFSYLN